MMKISALRCLAVPLITLLFAACAQSPQQIVIAPTFPETAQGSAAGQPVHVRVSDQRVNKILGSRGGSYRDTAVITVADGFSLAVQDALKTQLAALGYRTDSLSAETVDLHVVFEELVYDHPEDDGVGYGIDMLAVVRAEAEKQGERYEGRYRIKRKQSFFGAPSEDHNVELVNALVSEVLGNMLADAELVGFIAK